MVRWTIAKIAYVVVLLFQISGWSIVVCSSEFVTNAIKNVNSVVDDAATKWDGSRRATRSAANADSEKARIIAGFVQHMSDDKTNITILAWQNVYNDDGTIGQVHTMELAIPERPERLDQERVAILEQRHMNEAVPEVAEDARSAAHDAGLVSEMELPEFLRGMRQNLQSMQEMHLPIVVTFEKCDRQGVEVSWGYVDFNRTIYKANNDIVMYNVTEMNAVPGNISAMLTGNLGEAMVLTFDRNGRFTGDHQSDVVPVFMGCVVDHEDATDEMLLAGPKLIAEVVVSCNNRSQIPWQLARSFSTAFPQYRWRTLVNPGYSWLSRDVTITLSYDNFDFDETSNVQYMVYGKRLSPN